MSLKAMTLVWERSRAKGSNLLVLLAIADYAKDTGRDAWPTPKKLAARGRLTLRGVRYILDKLIAAGELVMEANRTRTVGDGVVPPYFFHIRCISEWEKFSHERPPIGENFSLTFPADEENFSFEKEAGFPQKGSRLPRYKEDPLSDPSFKQEQGAAPPIPVCGNVENSPAPAVRVITKLAHETIDRLGAAAALGDLTEAIKCRCAQLHLAYDGDVVRRALDSALRQQQLRQQLQKGA